MSLKARLAANEFILGTFLKTPSTILVEVLASCGLDCLCIDAEHAPFDRLAIDQCVMGARALDFPVLVRTPTASPEHILNALDCGADGVLLPHIRSAVEAAAAVKAADYGPGGRGYAGSSRAARYGLSSIDEHQASSSARTVVVAQVEDIEAVQAIDEIAAVPGLDAIFIGRIDLTVALGCTDPDAAPVIEAVERVIASCRAAAVPVGMFVPRHADVPAWRAKGVSLFLQGSEHALIRAGAASMRSAAGC